MECERLNRLVRSWYLQVQEEALAPARMVEFMEKHLKGCGACLADPDVRAEVKKITEIVLPPSKMVKTAKEDEGEEEVDNSPPAEEEDEEELSGDDGEDDGDEEEDEDEELVAPSVVDEKDDDNM